MLSVGNINALEFKTKVSAQFGIYNRQSFPVKQDIPLNIVTHA